MKTKIIDEQVKKITAENGLVLSNGGEFDMYPIEIYTSIDDDTWFEIVELINIKTDEYITI